VVDQAITPHGTPVVQRLLEGIEDEAGPMSTKGPWRKHASRNSRPNPNSR
jgi:hypothetical protein